MLLKKIGYRKQNKLLLSYQLKEVVDLVVLGSEKTGQNVAAGGHKLASRLMYGSPGKAGPLGKAETGGFESAARAGHHSER
jgi:hypothetical protein